MTWVFRQGFDDLVYRMRWGDLYYEVHKDARVYEIKSDRHMVRVGGTNCNAILEEMGRREDGPWWRRWTYRLTAKWRPRWKRPRES